MKEQPKTLTVPEMLEALEQKKDYQFLDAVRRLTEYEEMKLVKAKRFLKESHAVLLIFGSVVLFYIALLVCTIAIEVINHLQ